MSQVIHLDVAIAFAPLQPGILHRCNLAIVGWRYWVGSCYLLQRFKPVPALGAHSLKNERHHRWAHADDFLEGGVRIFDGRVRMEESFFSPPVGQFVEALAVGRLYVH